MAYQVTIEGMDEISRMLEDLGEKAEGVAARGLYKGAGVMRHELEEQVRGIKTREFKYAKEGETRLPSPEEKEMLMGSGSIGVAKFDKNGSEVNTSVGFDMTDYERVEWNHMSSKARTNYKEAFTKHHWANQTSFLKLLGMGKGEQNLKPIAVIANAINSGTSFMQKQPFVRQAANKGGKKAEAAIRDEIEKLLEDMTKA